MTKIKKALIFACIACLCCGWTSADLRLPEHYYSGMMGISRSKIGTWEKVRKLELEYDRVFARHSGELSKLGDDDVLAMFRSANMMASYTIFFETEKNHRFLAAMERSYSELQRRGAAPAGVALDMTGAYVAARRFADANRVIAENKETGIAMLPSSVPRENFVANRPGAFFVDATSDRVALKNLDTTIGDVIVIVAG